MLDICGSIFQLITFYINLLFSHLPSKMQSSRVGILDNDGKLQKMVQLSTLRKSNVQFPHHSSSILKIFGVQCVQSQHQRLLMGKMWRLGCFGLQCERHVYPIQHVPNKYFEGRGTKLKMLRTSFRKKDKNAHTEMSEEKHFGISYHRCETLEAHFIFVFHSTTKIPDHRSLRFWSKLQRLF